MPRAAAGRTVATALVMLAGTVAAAGGRFVEDAPALVGESVRWVSLDHGRLAFGAGTDVVVRDEHGERRWDSGSPTIDGLLGGGTLVVVTLDSRVLMLDLHEPGATLAPHHAAPMLHGAAFLARTPDRLVLAETGVGLHLLPLPGQHHVGSGTLSTTVRIEQPITAVTAAGWLVTLAGPAEELLQLDVRDPRRRRRVRLPPGLSLISALAVSADRLVALTADRLLVASDRDLDDVDWISEPAIGGSDLAPAGRVLYVARGSGIARVRDRSAGSVLYPVTVANNFFSPAALEIDVGDRVRWTNASGFHNVYACESTQSGCEGKTANEAFTSGAPAPALWIHSYTFTAAGSNPYVCQSHAPFMTGQVVVSAPPAGPPPIPDGDAAGSPMTIGKQDPAGDLLEVVWDALSCPAAVDTQLLWGSGSALRGGAYDLLDARCDVGPVPPFLWTSPQTSLDPGGLIWWVLAATDGAVVEGSWGTDGAGDERVGPGPGGSSGRCGVTMRDATARCPP